LLFEMFEWREAEFEYEPDFQVQPILRIGLSLRGQALAFHGVKKLDDSQRRRPGRRGKPLEAESWDLPFENKEVDERYWDLLERIGASVEPEEGRRLFTAFREFAQSVQALSRSPVVMHALHEDRASLLSQLLRQPPGDPAGVLSTPALYPCLPLAFLSLA